MSWESDYRAELETVANRYGYTNESAVLEFEAMGITLFEELAYMVDHAETFDPIAIIQLVANGFKSADIAQHDGETYANIMNLWREVDDILADLTA